MRLQESLLDFFHLFYPHLCVACHQRLYRQEEIVCTTCEHELYTTGFEKDLQTNVVYNQFIGRVPVQEAYALYHFHKGAVLQELLHALKYKQRKDVGIYLGHRIADHLQQTRLAQELHAIVPLPLHPRKQLKRGYNQATLIAQGIADKLHIPLAEHIVVRRIENPSQTKQNRYTRWDNVENIFETLHKPSSLPTKILLIDDVITTGATMEACATALHTAGYQVSIASVATVL